MWNVDSRGVTHSPICPTRLRPHSPAVLVSLVREWAYCAHRGALRSDVCRCPGENISLSIMRPMSGANRCMDPMFHRRALRSIGRNGGPPLDEYKRRADAVFDGPPGPRLLGNFKMRSPMLSSLPTYPLAPSHVDLGCATWDIVFAGARVRTSVSNGAGRSCLGSVETGMNATIRLTLRILINRLIEPHRPPTARPRTRYVRVTMI